jgi:transcriptional regulator with XRE-family HTH domain
MNISERIKAARKECLLTQEDLAKKAGISIMSTRRYESGERSPNLDTLERIATALDVPIERLLGREVIMSDLLPPQNRLTQMDLTEEEVSLINDYRKSDVRGKVNIKMVSFYEKDYATIKKSGIDNPLRLGVNLPSIRKQDIPQSTALPSTYTEMDGETK